MNELSLLLMLLVLGPERASASVRGTAPSALPAAVAAPVATTTTIQPLRGRVDAVDLANRRLTLTDARGTRYALKVGAAVYNLADIAAGDRVIVQGTTTLALSIRRER